MHPDNLLSQHGAVRGTISTGRLPDQPTAAREPYVHGAMSHLNNRVGNMESTLEMLVTRLEGSGVLMPEPPGNNTLAKPVPDGPMMPPLAAAMDSVRERIDEMNNVLQSIFRRLEI